MDSVVVGNSITRECHYFLDGTLADPTLPRLTIRDPNGTAVVQDGTPTRVMTGIYQYVYAVPLGAPIGNYTDEWTGVLSGVPAPAIDYWSALPLGSAVPVPSLTYTYNLATDVGKLRMLIQDTDMSSVSTALPLEQRSAVFTDEELQTLLDLNGQDLFESASVALMVWATNKNLLVVSRRMGKADIDFGSIRMDLMKMSDTFHQQAIQTPADGLAEQTWTDFTMRQVINNFWLRNDV